MTYRTYYLGVALLGFALTGCRAHNDFQKKWPNYPHWGWWNHPAKNVPEPAADPPAGDDAQDADQTTEAHASETSANDPTGPATLEEHRAEVWENVVVLRDVDELPPPEQRKLIESARRNLRKWYRPMTVSPPKPDDPQWITVLVWDFMPEEDFQTATDNWRRTARQEKLPFPEDVTRRELMDFITKITSGELKPALPAKTKTPPAAESSDSPAEKKANKGKVQ